MENVSGQGEFDLYLLLEKLGGYLPNIEMKDIAVHGRPEPCITLQDARQICNAIIKASEDGPESELFASWVPGARKTLFALEQIETKGSIEVE